MSPFRSYEQVVRNSTGSARGRTPGGVWVHAKTFRFYRKRRRRRLTRCAASREPADEDLRDVRASVPVAEEVESRVGRGALLLGAVPGGARRGKESPLEIQKAPAVGAF